MNSIGIYAGTFDPIHDGHIAFASAATAANKLDKVLFLPEAAPRHKPSASDLQTRLILLKNATKNYTHLDILELECEQFSVKSTLPKIQALTIDAELHFLVGSDVLATMHTWPNVNQLLAVCTLVIGLRHDSSKAIIEGCIKNLAKETSINFTHQIISTDHAHLASSQLR